MKAIVVCYKDTDPGAGANDLTLLAEVNFVGTEAEIPGRVISDMGALGNGVPIPIVITQLANYPNAVEDALIARVAELKAENPPRIAAGVTLARTDCLFPSYQRGA